MRTILVVKKFISKQILDIKIYGPRELFRKFCLLILLPKYLVKIILNIIAVLPCILIRLISPWFVIRIEQLPASNFGNFASFPALYYCKKKLKINQPAKKFLDLVYISHNQKNCNKQMVKMWKRKLNFLSPYLLNPIYRANKIIPGSKTHTIEILNSISERDVNNLFERCQPILEFTSDEEVYGKKMLNKFGLKDEDKFVCFAVRDEAYDIMRITKRFKDWSYHDFRNNDINNYVLAAEELTKKGYYVFRMGVVAEKPFKSNNPKIIDYANSNLRSDFMDIYLGAKCSFCISSNFGPLNLFEIFGKLIAQVSVPFASSHTHSEKSLILTPHHILKREKRELSLSEIFSYGVAYAYETKIFNKQGIELVENTPEEIKDLALEVAENFESKKKSTYEDEELQKTFKNLFSENYKFPNPIKDSNPYWKNPMVHGQIRACYGTKFLRDNKNWLS